MGQAVDRDTVLNAIDLYGRAWTTQNVSLLSKLFTTDAVYIERAYDRNATFRGLEAIQAYWSYQICGKQSNIVFRHVAQEMVRDADGPVAVVKWLAEFDNRREHRVGATSDKTNKRVRFCQLAKLVFRNDKICYLEEYAQSVSGPGARWPGLGKEVSDDQLRARLIQDPTIEEASKTTLGKDVVCTRCQSIFPSRTQLFRHLGETRAEREDDDGKEVGCVLIGDACAHNEKPFEWVCLSLGYSCSENIADRLLKALNGIAQAQQARTQDDEVDTFGDEKSFTWAVDPSWSVAAVVNVCSIKLNQSFLRSINVESLASLLTQWLGRNGTNDNIIRIHKAVVVDRPCVPERREFEKYEAFVPWEVLQGQEMDEKVAATCTDYRYAGKGWSRASKHCRRPLEETAAFKYVEPKMAQRLRDGARLLRDCGRNDLSRFADVASEQDGIKVRIRTRSMEVPWERLCRISVHMRQPRSGDVEAIIGLLIKFAQSDEMEKEDLTDSALELLTNDKLPHSSSFPRQHMCLLGPAITRYEGKVGSKLCCDGSDVPSDLAGSTSTMEAFLLGRIQNSYLNISSEPPYSSCSPAPSLQSVLAEETDDMQMTILTFPDEYCGSPPGGIACFHSNSNDQGAIFCKDRDHDEAWVQATSGKLGQLFGGVVALSEYVDVAVLEQLAEGSAGKQMLRLKESQRGRSKSEDESSHYNDDQSSSGSSTESALSSSSSSSSKASCWLLEEAVRYYNPAIAISKEEGIDTSLRRKLRMAADRSISQSFDMMTLFMLSEFSQKYVEGSNPAWPDYRDAHLLKPEAKHLALTAEETDLLFQEKLVGPEVQKAMMFAIVTGLPDNHCGNQAVQEVPIGTEGWRLRIVLFDTGLSASSVSLDVFRLAYDESQDEVDYNNDFDFCGGFSARAYYYPILFTSIFSNVSLLPLEREVRDILLGVDGGDMGNVLLQEGLGVAEVFDAERQHQVRRVLKCRWDQMRRIAEEKPECSCQDLAFGTIAAWKRDYRVNEENEVFVKWLGDLKAWAKGSA